ncbi:MAG: DEAD/DEAH box helicase [Bdellovibrionales bacterium]|nr:DEAD/DEAH box helicase [Bdellovibrionales bacterium]
MEEENTVIEDVDGAQGEEQAVGHVQHVYYEVGNDLLAKPNALADVLEMSNNASTIIFCNTPSEADMVNVMLSKKGIPSYKLIGNVPFGKVAAAIERIEQGQLRALVITDVAARDMEVGAFDLVINYSIHEDPEIYLHRHSGAESSESDTKVISLVSPLDFGNFHYLKKVVDFEIEKEELPSQVELMEARSTSFFDAATEVAPEVSERYASYIEKILTHDDKEKIVAYLLERTLEALPAAQSQAGNKGGRGRDRDNDRDRDRDNRDRDNRDRDNGREYRGRGEENSDRRDSYQKREYVPPKKDIRIYLGHGTASSFSEETLSELIKECSDASVEEAIKRFSIREHYSFVDIPEEIAESVLETLKTASLADGAELFFRKATSITVPRDENASDEDAQEEVSEEIDNDDDVQDDLTEAGAAE